MMAVSWVGAQRFGRGSGRLWVRGVRVSETASEARVELAQQRLRGDSGFQFDHQTLVPPKPPEWLIALGKFHESVLGEITPRTVMILVEWESREAFESYRADPNLQDLHAHRVNGTSNYIWHLFDKLTDLRPILK